MNWWSALLGLAVGGVVTAVLALIRIRLKQRQEEREALAHKEVISAQAQAAISILRSAAMLVGPHDEVMSATELARSLGVARGTRIAIPELLSLVREVRKSNQNLTCELVIPRGIGVEPLPGSARIANLGGGTLIVLVDDLSERRRMDAARRDFVANISHELKTPIGAVAVLAEAIEAAAADPEAVLHFSSRMQQEAKRLSDLVGQIIELSRVQADDPMLVAERVDLADVVADALSRNREVAQKREVNLVTSMIEDAYVLGDAACLGDAVSNLVTNAIAYSEHRARVSVSLRRVEAEQDQLVELAVSDNGIGIKPEDHERVFDRFYRVDYGRSRANGGTGLGLSIVRHIVSAHGGTVSLWSQPGRGSTFTISLPAYLEE